MAVNLSESELQNRQLERTEQAVEDDAFQKGLDDALSFVSANSVDSDVVDLFEKRATSDATSNKFISNFKDAILE
jgi:hypothetical protein